MDTLCVSGSHRRCLTAFSRHFPPLHSRGSSAEREEVWEVYGRGGGGGGGDRDLAGKLGGRAEVFCVVHILQC